MSADRLLGTFEAVRECAARCAEVYGCRFFIYGRGEKRGQCYYEFTESEGCPEVSRGASLLPPIYLPVHGRGVLS